MKYFITLILIFLNFNIYSQHTSIVEIKKTEISINTAGTNSVILELMVDLSQIDTTGTFVNDNDLFISLDTNFKPKLISKKFSDAINQGETVTLEITKKSIRFEITKVSDELIGLLNDNVSDIYITVDQDIIFQAWKENDESTLVTIKVAKSQVEKHTRSMPILTESMAKEIIDAKGGEIFLTQNNFDFGIIPSEQSSSSKTEINVTFNYRTRYSFLKNKLPIYFSAKGLIGTNSRDSLNYISIYPVSYNFSKGTNEFIGQIGIEGNQVFSNYRISGNFFWNGIIPNIVNLTFGEDRLRLKPVIKAGIKFYQEIENNRPVEINSNEFSNQVFGEFYYYIPVQKIYSLIIEGTVFYDFNLSVNSDKKTMFNYSVIFGLDIPKTDFKTIFKYSKGENGISYQKNDYFIIGLMIDSFGLN